MSKNNDYDKTIMTLIMIIIGSQEPYIYAFRSDIFTDKKRGTSLTNVCSFRLIGGESFDRTSSHSIHESIITKTRPTSGTSMGLEGITFKGVVGSGCLRGDPVGLHYKEGPIQWTSLVGRHRWKRGVDGM